MKKIFVVLVFIAQNTYACPGFLTWAGGFSFYSTVTRLLLRNHNTQNNTEESVTDNKKSKKVTAKELEQKLTEIEDTIKEELNTVITKWEKNEITKEELSHTVMGMYMQCIFVLPKERLNQLFPMIKTGPTQNSLENK